LSSTSLWVIPRAKIPDVCVGFGICLWLGSQAMLLMTHMAFYLSIVVSCRYARCTRSVSIGKLTVNLFEFKMRTL
jgi:hypothetical protein